MVILRETKNTQGKIEYKKGSMWVVWDYINLCFITVINTMTKQLGEEMVISS